jgi:hypothetical protein
MTTYAKMLSTLAIGAATLVTITFNCDDALARSGGGGGMRSFSGARSFSVARTPIVVSKVRTVRTVSAPVSVRSKVNSLATRTKIKPSNLATVEKRRLKSTRLIPVNDQNGNPGGGGSNPPPKQPPVVVPPPTIPPGVTNPPLPPKQPPVVVPPTIPPVVVHPPLPPKQPPVVVPPTLPPVVVHPPLPPKQPPVIVVDPVPHPHPHPVYPPAVSVGIGAVAPVVEADPPGCTYERTTRHTPGVGLQRVIIKICPDA